MAHRSRLLCLCMALVLLAGFSSAGFAQVKINGFLQNWWILNKQTDPVANHPGVETSTSGFSFQRARVNFNDVLDETFTADVWLELVGATSKALLDFSMTAKIDPAFNVTAGLFTPGAQMYESGVLSSSKLMFFERALITQRVGTNMLLDGYHDVGIQISGKYDIVKYSGYYGNGLGRTFYADKNITNRKFGNGLMGLRVDVEPVKGLTIGGHYSMNKQDSIRLVDPSSSVVAGTTPALAANPSYKSYDRNSYSLVIGADGVILPELYLWGEYGAGTMNDVIATGAVNSFNGYFLTAAYKVLPQLQVLVRFDALTESAVNAAADQKNTNLTLGATYFFFKEKVDIVKIGLNYYSRSFTPDPTGTKQNMLLAFVQFRI